MDQVPDTAQHYIECDTESCRNFSEFYCNTCHQRTCAICRGPHLWQNIGHEIVLYQERKRKLPSEKCRIHPTEDMDVYCDDCQDPVCSTCFALDHNDHAYSDLETFYNDTLQQCQKELTDIWETVIPEAKDKVKSLCEKRENTKTKIATLRLYMKKRAYKLKKAVDMILTYNNAKLDEIENSVDDLVEHQKKTEGYINYVEKLITDYESTMPSIKPTDLVKFHIEISLAPLKMPDLSKPKLPVFTPGTLNEEDILSQFGEIEINSSDEISSSVTKVTEVNLHGSGIFHLSSLPPDKCWASDGWGNLIQFDMKGNILQKISKSMYNIQCNHTVTTEGEVLYSNYRENIVYRVTSDMSTTKLMSTGDWEPGAIYSSHINGHILVGMERNEYMKITRYSKEGRKLQDIQKNDKGQNIYQNIYFITENINGDICASDIWASEVVVVTRSGDYKFSYSGHQSGFHPCGIATDVLGHILVCNANENNRHNCSSVHLLDMDGHFLFLLLTPNQCPLNTRALCIDNEHHLLVGGWNSSTVTVYKYFQKTDK